MATEFQRSTQTIGLTIMLVDPNWSDFQCPSFPNTFRTRKTL